MFYHKSLHLATIIYAYIHWISLCVCPIWIEGVQSRVEGRQDNFWQLKNHNVRGGHAKSLCVWGEGQPDTSASLIDRYAGLDGSVYNGILRVYLHVCPTSSTVPL